MITTIIERMIVNAKEWLELYFELRNIGDVGRMLHPIKKQFLKEIREDELLDEPLLGMDNMCSWCVKKALACLREES